MNRKLCNPYARIYLAKQGDSKENKKKTQLVKKSLQPKWEETFYFDMPYSEVKERKLIVNIKHAKRMLEKAVSQFLGEVNFFEFDQLILYHF